MQTEWLSIEFGHIALIPDTVDKDQAGRLADDQQVIINQIPDDLRCKLVAGGPFTAPDNPADDDWVVAVLQGLIDVIMGSAFKVHICPSDVLHLRPRLPKQHIGPLTSPDSGTHCRLRGNRWVNERTFQLFSSPGDDGKRAPWLDGKLSKGHVATLTFVWVCRELAACPPVSPPAS